MKKLKLFPKTFLYTLLMLLLINLSLHGMIYFFYPRVCLHRAEKNLEKQIDELQERLLTGEEARQGELFYDFAREKQVNLTVETPGGAKTYQGLGFQISLLQNADTVFQVSNLDGAQAIIVKSRALRQTAGSELQVEVMASARPLPRTLLTRVSTARENLSYMVSMYSAVMPMPLSEMTATSRTRSGLSATGSSNSSKPTVPPSGVYFTALKSRFV